MIAFLDFVRMLRGLLLLQEHDCHPEGATATEEIFQSRRQFRNGLNRPKQLRGFWQIRQSLSLLQDDTNSRRPTTVL